jgi:hypothetical protein
MVEPDQLYKLILKTQPQTSNLKPQTNFDLKPKLETSSTCKKYNLINGCA